MEDPNQKTPAPVNPLTIEIYDLRRLCISVGEAQIGFIQELKLHASADKIPPILEVTLPEIVQEMSDEVKKGIGDAIEVLQSYGAQIHFRPMGDFTLEANPEEQTQAEQALVEQVISAEQ